MTAAYIDSDYIDAFIGADVRTALFTTPTVPYSATQLTTVIQAASADIQMAAKHAGYTLGDTTTDILVKNATLGRFLVLAPGARKGLKIPDAVAAYSGYMQMIYDGVLPLSADPATRAAIGGVEHSESSSTATGDTWAPVFSRPKLGPYY